MVRARGAGSPTDRSTTKLLALFRALEDPGDEVQVVGREGGGHGQGPASGSRQEGRGQRDADKQKDHENTLPFIGRVVGHVRLYGERGREGGE